MSNAIFFWVNCLSTSPVSPGAAATEIFSEIQALYHVNPRDYRRSLCRLQSSPPLGPHPLSFQSQTTAATLLARWRLPNCHARQKW